MPDDPVRALHEAEERYRLAARATDDATWDYDLLDQTVRWNEALTRRFGHAPKDLFTRVEWWSDHIYPGDIQRVTDSIEAVIAGTGESWTEEYRFRRADGSYADVLDRGFVIRDEQGRGTRMVGAMLDLSDRRRTEAALRASEERLRLAQEAGRLGTFEWNAGHEGADVSDTHCDILGLPRGKRITNAEFRSVIHPDDLPRVAAHGAEVRAGTASEDIEFRVIRPSDGATRWVWLSARTFRNGEGKVIRQIGVSEDITERKLAADRLRDSEEMLRLAQEAAGIGSFEWNLKTGESRGSPTAYRIFGLPPTDKINLPSLTHIIHPDDQDEVRDHILRAGRGETHSSIEHRVIRTTDGVERWLRVTGRTLPDAAGDLMRRVGIVEDITDEKLAEARLRESEENYRFTVELSPQLAWTANGDGSCVELKRPITEYPGVPMSATFDDWADDVIHPDDATYRRRAWVHSMKTGSHYDCEFRARHRDGSFRWVRSRGWPRRDETGAVVKWYGVIEDVHPQRAAEQQLQRLQDELTQVARVSAMGTLASALAHELNQPLTAVANYMAGSKRLLVNHGAAATDVVLEALDNAAKSAVQAGEIVRRLRDLVSRGEVNAQRVEIATLVHEACELTFGDGRGRSIDQSFDFAPEAAVVLADRIQLQQVLVNLLRNAAEAMEDSELRSIRLSAKPSGDDMALIRVEDSGTGVAPQVKRHLFSPFVTTKESGMGVGLSICRSIVEAHGGQLWVEDAPGGGAAFCFTLKRAD
ncbi:PAS domain-containing protein [Sphingoaurantiacus capsulatus]|uniref:histidine kinase n=1 Tax=Sphingoaurantiacus capsulatus TaxID=1771310 RepID=A0ABV7XG79_9SPHN